MPFFIKIFCLVLLFVLNIAFAKSLQELAQDPETISHCFKKDDPFIYCIFLSNKQGWIAVDKNNKQPYQLYIFDNGPDYPKDELFRIIKNQKIGYADAITGRIVIFPQYDCAFPFENGKAKVGFNCQLENDGEHSWWVGGDWFIIDKKGRIIQTLPSSK